MLIIYLMGLYLQLVYNSGIIIEPSARNNKKLDITLSLSTIHKSNEM